MHLCAAILKNGVLTAPPGRDDLPSGSKDQMMGPGSVPDGSMGGINTHS